MLALYVNLPNWLTDPVLIKWSEAIVEFVSIFFVFGLLPGTQVKRILEYFDKTAVLENIAAATFQLVDAPVLNVPLKDPDLPHQTYL